MNLPHTTRQTNLSYVIVQDLSALLLKDLIIVESFVYLD